MEQQTFSPESPVVVESERKPGFRLHRSRTEKMLGGVCGGMAESLDVDPNIVRIGVVALTVLGGGLGAVLYIAAWVLAPEE
jgi:phage shock protein C